MGTDLNKWGTDLDATKEHALQRDTKEGHQRGTYLVYLEKKRGCPSLQIILKNKGGLSLFANCFEK